MRQSDKGVQAVGARGVRWRKSRHSNPSGSCVEVGDLGAAGVGVRHSRFPAGPALVCTRVEIAAFLAGVKDGEFDDLIRRDHGGQQRVTVGDPHPGMLVAVPLRVSHCAHGMVTRGERS